MHNNPLSEKVYNDASVLLKRRVQICIHKYAKLAYIMDYEEFKCKVGRILAEIENPVHAHKETIKNEFKAHLCEELDRYYY